MLNKDEGVKYPKQLAISETSSRRRLDQLKLFNDELDPFIAELKKSLYTHSVAHSTIYDGLSLACSMLYDKKWQDDKTGDWHDIIGRKDDITETHYRLFAPENFIKTIFAGPFEDEWPNVRNQLLKLALRAEPKKLPLDKNHYIIDTPIKVTPWYETDNIEKFFNLSPRRKGKGKGEAGKIAREQTGEREIGKVKGKIIGFSIEFFKPYFTPLLERNKRGKVGKNYLLTPPYFQLKLNDMFRGAIKGTQKALLEKQKELESLFNDAMSINLLSDKQINDIRAVKNEQKLKAQAFRKKTQRKLERATPLDVRKLYLALALKDNHEGEYITIENLADFIEGIWPELVRINTKGENTLPPAQYKKVTEKIDFILEFYFQVMARRGDMDGGQIVPYARDKGERFNRETDKMRILCIKKNTLFSKYTLNDTAKFLLQA